MGALAPEAKTQKSSISEKQRRRELVHIRASYGDRYVILRLLHRPIILCFRLRFPLPLFGFRFRVRSQDDPITLWVNKVGPYNNPQETYNYYSLPFCHPGTNPAHKWGALGEVLAGNELIDSHTDIKFQTENVDKGTLCQLELDEAKVRQFKDAIENSYWFEFFIDDLPLWGFVGELHRDKNSDNIKHVFYSHKNIVIKYNKDQIIHVNLTQENPKPLEAGRALDMTYLIKWIPTNVTFACRFDVYLDYPFFEHQSCIIGDNFPLHEFLFCSF